MYRYSRSNDLPAKELSYLSLKEEYFNQDIHVWKL